MVKINMNVITIQFHLIIWFEAAFFLAVDAQSNILHTFTFHLKQALRIYTHEPAHRHSIFVL